MSVVTLNNYETVYILKASLSESDANTIHTKIDNVITKFEGKLLGRDDWGVREMAYEIDDERSGRYLVLGYTGKSGVVEEIERHFKISPDVLRYLTIAVDANYSYDMVKKQIALAEEEIKKNREARDQRKKFQGGGHGGGRDFQSRDSFQGHGRDS